MNITLFTIIVYLLPIVAMGQDDFARTLPRKRVVAQSSEEVLVLKNERGEVVSAQEETEADPAADENMETEAVETTTTTVTKKIQRPKPAPVPVPEPQPVVQAPVVQPQPAVTVTPGPQGAAVSYGGDVYNFYFQKAPGPQQVIQGPGPSVAPAPVAPAPQAQQQTVVDDEEEEEDEEVVQRPPRSRSRSTMERPQVSEAKDRRTNYLQIGGAQLRFKPQTQSDFVYLGEAENEALSVGFHKRLGKYWDINFDYLVVSSPESNTPGMASALDSNVWQAYFGFSPIQFQMRDDMSLEFGLIGGVYRGAVAETSYAYANYDAFDSSTWGGTPVTTFSKKTSFIWGPRAIFRLTDRFAFQISGQLNKERGIDNFVAGIQFGL